MLAPCTAEAVAFVKRHADRVVEIGAGDGCWARALRRAGVPVKAFDLHPRGSGVTQGDHLAAAQHEGALLAVWPPDGLRVHRWAEVKPWPAVITCGSPSRFGGDRGFTGYDLTEEIHIPKGDKGGNVLSAYRRLADG